MRARIVRLDFSKHPILDSQGLLAYIKIRILRWLRLKVSDLGEYCNNNPFDDFAYGMYLILTDIFY